MYEKIDNFEKIIIYNIYALENLIFLQYRWNVH